MHKGVSTVKSKPKALQHFKVDPVLKIHEAVYNLCQLNKCGNPITDLRLKKGIQAVCLRTQAWLGNTPAFKLKKRD